MEKLTYLVPSATSRERVRALEAQLPQLSVHTRGLSVVTPVTEEAQTASFAAALFVWVACIDRRLAFEHALSDFASEVEGYLVTESVVHGARATLPAQRDVTIMTLQQAPQLGQSELRARLAALSPMLRAQSAQHVSRDGVVRPLQTSASPLRALFTIVHAHPPSREALATVFDALGQSAQRDLFAATQQVIRPLGL